MNADEYPCPEGSPPVAWEEMIDRLKRVAANRGNVAYVGFNPTQARHALSRFKAPETNEEVVREVDMGVVGELVDERDRLKDDNDLLRAQLADALGEIRRLRPDAGPVREEFVDKSLDVISAAAAVTVNGITFVCADAFIHESKRPDCHPLRRFRVALPRGNPAWRATKEEAVEALLSAVAEDDEPQEPLQ